MLEDNVDEKYNLSEKGMQYICGNAYNPHLKDHIDRSKTKLNKEIAYTISTKQDRRCGDANFILDGYGETSIGDFLKIKNATKKGYLEAHDGDGIDISSRMQYHRGTVQKGKAQTITTSCDIGVVNNNLKIRKLTPKECFRLMGVKDEDIDKILKHQSNASAYHLAGDSIVVDVLMYIFGNMIGEKNEII
jgi:DNA (cytosine-5)-methyltransferase 1